ncbi:GRAM domain-containing protein [Zychaea mexicana]|uniref:GRAM domain-containing protein n=1 Tax=Zychaea mexicana TaxID=64656 RepID=UPI0022FE879F|nr:GRAM domain-containing protein [Zychaea mexicana]KAI9490646.1 GRAM domain-containing protein [Zychaea mexicana]
MTIRRRRRYFHSLFRSVPVDEEVLEIYRCALHKDILIQGHLYVSEHHACFKANIFGWVTTIILPFADIAAIEKRKTAKWIPNAIEIRQRSNQKQHVFASFMSRDQAYQLMTELWWKHNDDSRQRQQKQQHDVHGCNKELSRQERLHLPASNDKTVQQRQQTAGERRNMQQQQQDCYGWILLILVIVLLLSNLSIAYQVNNICYHLMQF